MPDLPTRVAVVTGGGTGIGRATAIRLAADGYEVADLRTSTRTSRWKSVAEIEANGGRCLARPMRHPRA